MEFGLTKAGALACAGNPTGGLELLEEVQGVSRWLEPQLLCQWIRSICLLLLGAEEAEETLSAAYDATVSSRGYDVFVLANRLHPAILALLAKDEKRHELLGAVLTRSNDHQRAVAEGIASGLARSDEPPLTRRERDVYALLAEGRSNREIAHALFISESTVKVHVGNILRKLGARSRVEAAIQAVRTRRPQEPAGEDRGADQPDSDPQG
jgi:DNA-binding NarL/FixJ family response regulator